MYHNMAIVKTGISLDRDLLERMTALAHTLHMSRSELFADAVKEFLKEHENKEIFDRLNAVYGDGADRDDERMLTGMRRLYNRSVDQEW